MAALALCGCDKMVDFETLAACSERIEAEFPAAGNISSEDIGDEVLKGLNSYPDGTFKFSVPDSGGAVLWACEGHMKSRFIDRIEFRGDEAVPSEKEVWNY